MRFKQRKKDVMPAPKLQALWRQCILVHSFPYCMQYQVKQKQRSHVSRACEAVNEITQAHVTVAV